MENEILDFKNVFDHEYEEKQNREEYDNLYRVITEFPSRSETEAYYYLDLNFIWICFLFIFVSVK